MDRTDSCVLCQSPAGAAPPGAGGYRVCAVCDVAWRVVQDSQDPAADWEQHYYADDRVRELHEVRISGLESIAARITEVCPSRGRLLDVGAGIGIFMEAMAKAGWSVEGIEPSGIAAQAARTRTKAPVHLGILETANLREASYDAVTFFDALRTVPDPMLFLRQARRLLRPGGMLIIREVYWRAELMRERLQKLRRQVVSPGRTAMEYRQCFSPKSLLFAFDRVGLLGAWVEPSPVFAELYGANSSVGPLIKRSIGWLSSSAYHLSGRRLLLGPNLLAYGKAPSL
jgi:2-polyprenyl-3-methyl-5-hydroxy-6-metoxy-1,4-benzoquinol methylase